MDEIAEDKVMSTVSSGSFVGRDEELEVIVRHAQKGAGALVIASKPAAGSSELLRQAYDRLFFKSGDTVPFFFEFRPSDKNVRRAAIRFLQAFLVQLTAFRRNDPQLPAITPDVCELSELTTRSDSEWINRLVDACKRESELSDEASFVRHALSAPLRAQAEKTSVLPLIGGLEHTKGFSGATDIFEQLKETLSAFGAPYVLSGKRRFLTNAIRKGTTRLSSYTLLELKGLNLEESGGLCGQLSDSTGVETSAQTRDLISLQTDGSPVMINALFDAASEQGLRLDSFKDVQQVYVGELFGGRIRGYFDSCFETLTADTETQRKIVDLVYGSKEFSKSPATEESWNQTLGLKSTEFRKLIAAVNDYEFVNTTSSLISVHSESTVFDDYINMRFRLEVERAARPSVYGETLTRALKRAPEMMAGHYRRSSSIGLRELLAVFNCQETPISLLFYNVFKELHKGKSDKEISAALKTEKRKVSLPQIVYSVNTVSVYGRLSKFTDKERSAVAIGFEAGDYTEENETVWIAAEIDSKLEADPELTGFWCDRLEMVALMGDYSSYRIWLIAPEGFSPEAVEILRERDAVGSSRKQVELLTQHLDAEDVVGRVEPDNTFELVVPMGEDTELIAAHAVEEIARRHNFDAKAINQIKTALVEACINATEHSKSPDRKIYQRFKVEDNKIVVTVSNRGLRFKGKKTKEITPTKGRRGWGLKLMKTLMDEVRFEQVDDGTRISMTKLLKTT